MNGCDKFECDIQCKIYDEENCVDMTEQENNKVYHNERVQEIIKNGDNSWSDMWLEFDRPKYSDENFIKVLNYVKKNNITK